MQVKFIKKSKKFKYKAIIDFIVTKATKNIYVKNTYIFSSIFVNNMSKSISRVLY